MACADGGHTEVGVLQLQHGLRQCLDGCGRRFLHEQVALLAVFKGVEDKIDGIAERHHKARHVRVRDGERLALVDLVAEQWDDRAA